MSEDGHAVTLIESEDSTADEVEERLDVRVVRGNGASALCLSKAGVGSCDFFMAMTAHDQLNIVAWAPSPRASVPERPSRGCTTRCTPTLRR